MVASLIHGIICETDIPALQRKVEVVDFSLSCMLNCRITMAIVSAYPTLASIVKDSRSIRVEKCTRYFSKSHHVDTGRSLRKYAKRKGAAVVVSSGWALAEQLGQHHS